MLPKRPDQFIYITLCYVVCSRKDPFALAIHVIPLLESHAFHKCNCSDQFVYVLSHFPCSVVPTGEHSEGGRGGAASNNEFIFSQNVLLVGESSLCMGGVSFTPFVRMYYWRVLS